MHDTYNGIKLDLESDCSWKWDPRTQTGPEKKQKMTNSQNKKEGNAFYNSFVDNCLGGYTDSNDLPMVGFNNCNITMLDDEDDKNSYWPEKCYQNIQS
jgi:hypothetical protein